MALQKSYTDVYGVTHATAYTRIDSVSVTHDEAKITVLIYHDADARSKGDASKIKQALKVANADIFNGDYTTYFADDVLKSDTKSPIGQAYEWLKAQTDYLDVNWTTETTDV